ncbi:GAG-pre-integrase domain-containing protein [Forsythia ovata]|uniref:GAG-pre-integrase domain-containing protein n=1 Tax=Forsythia ovata TaxID=205694 RepID=A0ABD1RKA0_9LAMI
MDGLDGSLQDGSSPTPTSQVHEGTQLVPNPNYKNWRKQDTMLLSLIYASLTEECMVEIVNASIARNICGGMKHGIINILASEIVMDFYGQEIVLQSATFIKHDQ